MGFYGNINSANKSSFQFDKIYANRFELDKNANSDGVFTGRYVLVDYDADTSAPAISINGENSGYSISTLISVINNKNNLTSIPANFAPGYLEQHFNEFIPYSQREQWSGHTTPEANKTWINSTDKNGSLLIHAGFAMNTPLWLIAPEDDTSNTIHGAYLPNGTFVAINGYLRTTYYYSYYYEEEVPVIDETTGEYKIDPETGETVHETVVHGIESLQEYENLDEEIKNKVISMFVAEPVPSFEPNDENPYKYPHTIYAVSSKVISTSEVDEETGEEIVTPKTVIDYSLIANLDESEFTNIEQFGVYRSNYLVDVIAYGHYGRGWDSTVWQKVYMDGKYSYRMIAELNSVVPTFDVTVDAPTAIPIPPYYDSDNSNVYYKLHVQPTWGMRVRAARALSNESTDSATIYPSDVKDAFIKDLTSNARATELPEADRDLAIYFNKDGFNRYINSKADYEGDIIAVRPTGIGYKNYYNNYENSLKPDTYELSIMLPSIGDSISAMWNIVYGDGSEYYKGSNENGLDNEVPGSVDFSNRYLWDKKEGGFSDAPTRNTNVAWNSYNGIRPKNLDGSYDYSKLSSLAANINYAHDLFGMIIREAENFDDVANWDPEKIYLINNKFYYKGKDYTYTDIPSADLDSVLAEGYYKPVGALTNVADGTYWKKELMVTEVYDDEEVSNNASIVQTSNTPYYNYIRIKEGEKVLEGTVLGKARITNIEKNIDLTTEGYVPNYYYKKKMETINGVEQAYYELDTEPSPSGDGQYYDVVSARADNNGAIKFYIPDQYCYATKLLSDFGDFNSTDSAIKSAAEQALLAWNIKSSYTTDDFNEIHLCQGYYVYTNLLQKIKDENKVVRFFPISDVEVHSYPASMEEDPTKPRIKSNITCPNDFTNYYTQDPTNPNIWKVSVPVYSTPEDPDEEPTLLYTLEETLPEGAVTLKDGVPSTYEAYLYLAEQDNGNIFIGGHTIYEFIKDPTLTPVLIVDGKTNKLRQIYQTVNKGARTVVSLPEEGIIPVGLTGIEQQEFYYCKGENVIPDEARGIKASSFHREDVRDLDKTISGENRFEQIVIRLNKGEYYTLTIKGQPVFYVIGENYYYPTPDKNNPDAFKKETVAKIKPAKSADEYAAMGYPRIPTTEHPTTAAMMAAKDAARLDIYYRLIEEAEDGEGVEWTDFEGTPFIPYKYYVRQPDGCYTLADEYDANATYYEKNDVYVNISNNDNYAHGAIWNKSINPAPAGVTLATREEQWVAKEIKDFTEDSESLHGLILAINRLLLEDDRETRDIQTVQGAINVMNDLLNRFNHLNVQEFVTIDEYGRVHSANWDTNQRDYIVNYGNGDIENDGISYANRWINLTLDPDADSPHFTINHTSKTVPDTTTISDKNTGAAIASPNRAGWNNTTNDTLKLYTPIVDNHGHIVGKNEETVTLPYGFKTITTNGRVSNHNTQTLGVQDDIVADNTQDTLGINSGNEWIRIETNANNDIITISHDAKETSLNTSTVDLTTSTDGNTTFVIPVDTFDSTNHFIGRVNTTYTLPNSYGIFEGDEGTLSEAAASHDTFSLTGDNWIKTTVSKDNVSFTHIGPVAKTHVAISNATPSFGGEFTIEDWTFDDKGHKTSGGTHTVKIPEGSLSVSENVDGAKVLTSASFVKATGALSITNKNVGELPLTGYSTVSSISGMPTASDSINTMVGKLAYVLNNSDTPVNTRISDAINELDSSYTASGATAGANITSASTVNVISKVELVNGKFTNGANVSTLVDAAGAAAAAKTEVIGTTADAKTVNTIYGAKAFATDAAGTAETNAKNYADTAASTAEQNAKDYVSTVTFTYTPKVENPDYNAEDPTSQQYIDGTPVTKTIEDWIAYIMENI